MTEGLRYREPVALGRVGVWWSGSWRPGEDGLEPAAELESLGFGALWSSGGFDPGLAPRFGRMLEATRRATVASGIVSIWASTADDVAAGADALEAAHPGRFLLGLGVSHAPLASDYARPYERMVGFLDRLDALGDAVSPERRMLAALRPRMLELAAGRSAGAHPYFVPVEHTARAREIMGPGAVLAPEVTVLLDEDPARARETARAFTRGYLTLPNYAGNLRSLGFADDELADGGSDRLVDAVVAHGDADRIAARVRAHHDAGADHVAVQMLGPMDRLPLEGYRALASALGLPPGPSTAAGP
ncbi:MAG: TIGR03620 family F420-dependent LLM class oxidoreductase [Acidimicrobiales bacterium]|nr:TIGR03620 family F420-dependent LLM class oxidoreductase [Acidimicrobiales bacterium]